MGKFRDLDEAADAAAKHADEVLDEELKALMEATHQDLQALKPKVTDTEEYEKLIAAVQTAKAQNENLAQLKERLAQLANGGVSLVKSIVDLLK